MNSTKKVLPVPAVYVRSNPDIDAIILGRGRLITKKASFKGLRIRRGHLGQGTGRLGGC